MAKNFRNFVDGININPKSVSTVAVNGDIDFSSVDQRLNLFANGTASVIVTNLSNDVLVNKTLINPQLAMSHNTAGTVAYNSSGSITIPNATDTLVGRATTDTLTNKTINAGSNTITNLTNANLNGSAAITNANLATMAASTIKGSVGGGTPSDLSSAQATSILSNFIGDSGSGGTKGLVPAPAAGDAAANKFLKADGTWTFTSGSGVTTIGTLDSQSKSANGAVISGTSLVMQTASGTFPGLVSTASQVFAGNKTFNGAVFTANIGDISGGNLSIATVGSLTLEADGGSKLIVNASSGTAFEEIASPGAPSASYVALYPKANGFFYQKTSSGTETRVTALIPHLTVLTSGSGTFTTNTNTVYLHIRMVGGGGGGCNGTGASGTAGGNTTFGTTLLAANGGGGATSTGGSGIGGTASLGSGPSGIAFSGAAGQGASATSTNASSGGAGGSSPFGGAGNGQDVFAGNAGDGVANTGSGGGGTAAGSSSSTGAGGGAGGYVDAYITSSIASTYAYAVGAGGNGTTNGGAGLIIVEEYY